MASLRAATMAPLIFKPKPNGNTRNDFADTTAPAKKQREALRAASGIPALTRADNCADIVTSRLEKMIKHYKDESADKNYGILAPVPFVPDSTSGG